MGDSDPKMVGDARQVILGRNAQDVCSCRAERAINRGRKNDQRTTATLTSNIMGFNVRYEYELLYMGSGRKYPGQQRVTAYSHWID